MGMGGTGLGVGDTWVDSGDTWRCGVGVGDIHVPHTPRNIPVPPCPLRPSHVRGVLEAALTLLSPRLCPCVPCLCPQSTRAVYERILDLRIATPQIVINYALLLEEHGRFEDSFKVTGGHLGTPGDSPAEQGAGGVQGSGWGQPETRWRHQERGWGHRERRWGHPEGDLGQPEGMRAPRG